MSATLLETTQLRVAVPHRVLIDGFDCAIRAGEFIALLGGNGTGKSLLLRTLAGLRAPAGGSVQLDGRDIHSLARRDIATRLGFLPQDPDAPPQGSLTETVVLGRFAHLGLLGDDRRIRLAARRAGARRRRPRGTGAARAGHAVGRRATPRRHRAAAGAGAFYLPARRADQSPRPGAAARHPRAPARAHARRARRSSRACTTRISRCVSRIVPACCQAAGMQRWSTALRSIPVISAGSTDSSMSRRASARSASWRRTESCTQSLMTPMRSASGIGAGPSCWNQKRRDLFQALAPQQVPETQSPGSAAADRAAAPRPARQERAAPPPARLRSEVAHSWPLARAPVPALPALLGRAPRVVRSRPRLARPGQRALPPFACSRCRRTSAPRQPRIPKIPQRRKTDIV